VATVFYWYCIIWCKYHITNTPDLKRATAINGLDLAGSNIIYQERGQSIYPIIASRYHILEDSELDGNDDSSPDTIFFHNRRRTGSKEMQPLDQQPRQVVSRVTYTSYCKCKAWGGTARRQLIASQILCVKGTEKIILCVGSSRSAWHRC
jgi:hypothetical protein